MASIKKKSSGGGGANWMDTYGDMVTLLLCFFVLLYSISTIEQDKWMVFVKSFNRDAIDQVEPIPGPVDTSDGSGGEGLPLPDKNDEVDEALDELYDFLVEYVESSAASSEISVSNGDGYVFISFAEAVFFRGNSSEMLPEGRAVLDAIIPALTRCGPSIEELEVIGHTAQVRQNSPNETVTDRHLASDRATEVVIYLQDHIAADIINPGRLVPKGLGQWRPVADNGTSEGMTRNRRVEMIVTGKDLESELGGNFEKYETMLHSTGSVKVSE